MDTTTVVPDAELGPAPQRAGRDISFLGIVLCFVLSGFAALLYQTAWMREFSIVFGTSELAIATVLAAYMAGLALGAGLAGPFARRVKRPVLVYGLLELGIALAALAVPLLLELARGLQVQLIGGQPGPPDAGALSSTVFYLVCAFFILGIPTALMGATLPILARQAVHAEDQIGRRVGLLYAMNTAGAVAGTLVAAFVLLPRLGLRGTVWAGVATNLLVFLLAAALSRGARPMAEDGEGAGSAPVSLGRARWILPLILISGSVSFTYEVLWTRLLSHVLGGSVHAFATMLAAFLTGITLGSAVASRFARTARGSAIGFAVVQLGTAILSIVIWRSMDGLPQRAAEMVPGRDIDVRSTVLLAMGVLLPATLCIGATFPFALRILARGDEDAGPVSGRVYAWNTVGAIVGAIVSGFWLIPALGFAGSAQVAISINLLLAVATVVLLGGFGSVARGLTCALAAAGILLTCVPLGLSGFPLTAPLRLLTSSPFPSMRITDLPVAFSKVGRSASVVMLERDGAFQLRTNGLPEAAIMPRGIPPVGRNQEWLSIFPVFARPAARDMLMIGLGGGVALERVPPSLESIDVIELEPEVIAANRAIAARRAKNPLADPRITLIENDARGALALTDRRYDVIVSQPSHPWTAGASHLYTREFMQQVDEHLTDEGVFVQWMNAGFVDEELFRTLGATLLSAFPHTRLYRPGPTFLLFMGSRSPLEVERDIAASGEPMASAPGFYAEQGFSLLEDVAASLALDHDGLVAVCAGAQPNTDDWNLLAMRSSPTIGQSLKTRVDELFFPHCPLFRVEGGLFETLGDKLDRVYMSARLVDLGLPEKGSKLATETRDALGQMLAVGRLAEIKRDTMGARKAFSRAYGIDPSNADAAYAVLLPSLPQLVSGEADDATRALLESLADPGRAVIEGAIAAEKLDWPALYRLEPRLAEASPRDFCFHDALRLRAMWRCYAGDPGDPSRRRELGVEALALVDQALVLSPQEKSFRVRAIAASAADDMDALVETCKVLAQFFEGNRGRGLSLSVQQEIRATLKESVTVLETMTPSKVLDPEAVAALRERFRAVVE